MEEFWKASLTDKGLLRLSYYIDEDIVSEYIEPPNQNSPLDTWVYEMLSEITKSTWVLQEPDHEQLLYNIYYSLGYSNRGIFENFKRAIKYIIFSKFIKWENVTEK